MKNLWGDLDMRELVFDKDCAYDAVRATHPNTSLCVQFDGLAIEALQSPAYRAAVNEYFRRQGIELPFSEPTPEEPQEGAAEIAHAFAASGKDWQSRG